MLFVYCAYRRGPASTVLTFAALPRSKAVQAFRTAAASQRWMLSLASGCLRTSRMNSRSVSASCALRKVMAEDRTRSSSATVEVSQDVVRFEGGGVGDLHVAVVVEQHYPAEL
jgi:hypothetical protein